MANDRGSNTSNGTGSGMNQEALDGASSRPLYVQLVGRLRLEIDSGRLPPGGRLPGEHELCRRYGVSRTTVRQALASMANDGLLFTVKGRGTYVAESAPGAGSRPPATHADAEGERAGRGAEGERAEPVGRAGSPGSWVGLIAPFPSEYLMPTMIGKIEEALHDRGFALRVYNSADEPDEEFRMVDRIVDEGAAGVIIMPAEELEYNARVAKLRAEAYPVVMIDRPYRFVVADCVMPDNFNGARVATEHLLSRGRRRVGFVARSTAETYSVGARFEGYRFALGRAGIPEDQQLVLFHDVYGHGAAGGAGSSQGPLHEALRVYLGRPDRPDAVFAVNDLVAMEIIRVASGMGIQVPGDLAVVGFDDASIARQFMVPLTTVRQPVGRIGREAVRLLLERLARPEEPARWVFVGTELVVRGSCGYTG